MIIAMDGTSGSGKSTLAKELAKRLNFGFFSAGALYRAITVKAINLNLDENDDEGLQELVQNTKIVYTYDGEKNVMLLDGININDRLHTEETSELVSKIAIKPYIREFVRTLQRDTASNNENIVMEGRDIGSVIFPNADLKIFVDCKIETRAKRRLNDLSKHEKVSLETVIKNLEERDYMDIHRSISPLVMCEDAILIDTTLNTIDECLHQIYYAMLKRNLVTAEFLSERGIDNVSL